MKHERKQRWARPTNQDIYIDRRGIYPPLTGLAVARSCRWPWSDHDLTRLARRTRFTLPWNRK